MQALRETTKPITNFSSKNWRTFLKAIAERITSVPRLLRTRMRRFAPSWKADATARLPDARRGSGGFGYDPLFLIPEYHQTFGELSSAGQTCAQPSCESTRTAPPHIATVCRSVPSDRGSNQKAAMSKEAVNHYSALTSDITAFRHYLQSERGLAENTLLAYGRDLDRFAGWVAGGGLPDYVRPKGSGA